MDEEARNVRTAVKRAVTETTNQTKRLARSHISSRLGRRAGFLLTSKIYDNGPVDKAGYIYSRWKRKAPGLGKPTDVMAAHAYGAVITPRQGRFLYIPLTRSRLGRAQRRIFQEGTGRDVALVPFTDKRGNLGYVVRDKTKRGRIGRAVAVLVQRVELRSRLNLEPIYQLAERNLTTRLITYLDRPRA